MRRGIAFHLLTAMALLGWWPLTSEAFLFNPRPRPQTTTTTAVYLEAPKFFTNILKTPIAILNDGGVPDDDDNDDDASNTVELDGSEASLLARAKQVLQSDLGLTNAEFLDDETFAWLDPNVDTPLSKSEYLAAGRFFNLRKAFPDWDYRAYDFRVCGQDTVRCTCRVTGTMRGELRLRSGILMPTGRTMRCPPEAISITFDLNTGKVTKLCSGFVLDRLVGNTDGLCGVQAASVIAGQAISPFEILPATTVLGRVLARPAKPIPETTTFLAPFPETVMIQLTKGVISTNMASKDPTLLGDDFTFCTSTKGPVRKQAFLEQFASQELSVDGVSFQPNFSNYRVDPYDPVRVWVDLEPTVPGVYEGPPQAISFAFDEDGYCTRITSWAVMDPSIGNAGGLGGPEGYRYATGKGSLGLAVRPLPRTLGRLGKRLLGPLTGTSVDEYKPRKNKTTPSLPAAFTPSAPKVTPSVPKVTPSVPEKKKESPKEVEERLEGLAGIAKSIQILPASISKSFSLQQPPAADQGTKAKSPAAKAPKAKSPAAKLPNPPKSPPTVSKPTLKKKESPKEVEKRLEGLAGIAKSIQILPSTISKSFSIQPPTTTSKSIGATKAASPSGNAAAAAAAAKKAKEEAERQRIAKAAALRKKKLAQLEEAELKRQQIKEQQEQLAAERKAEAEQRKATAQAQAEERRAEAERKKMEADMERRAAAERKKQEAEEKRAAAKAEADRKKAEAAEKKAAAAAAAKLKQEEAKRLAAERAAKSNQAEEKKAAALAAAEAKKEEARMAAIQRATERRKQQEEAERKREEAAARRATAQAASEQEREAKLAEIRAASDARKAAEREAKLAKAKAAQAKKKLAEVSERVASRKKSGQSISIPLFQKGTPSQPVQPTSPPSRSIPLFENLSKGTVSLFGRGKSELEELPPAKEASSSRSVSVSKKAPRGVPTLNRWKQNKDKSITGLVSGSDNFDAGDRITTSPIESGTIASGEVVKTGSGSRYFLA